MCAKPDLALLFGAGASADAGLPTALEMSVRLEKDLERERPGLLPVYHFIVGAIQFGRGCRNEPATGSVNIEEFLNACTFLASRSTHYVYPFVSSAYLSC